MRTALVQIYDPIEINSIGDIGFLVLEKYPEGGVKVINDYVFDLDKISYHDIIDILSVKLHDRGFDKIFLENTRSGKSTPFDIIRSARSKDISKFENQLRKDFNLKPEHARLMSHKMYIDKDIDDNRCDPHRCDPSNEYDKRRNALFMSNPEKYSKMLRKKKLTKSKSNRKPVKKCRCK
jgi:hypothetical protein